MTIEKWSPLYLWRAWDTEWQLAGQWSEKPLLSELVEGGALTLDYPGGHRTSWNVRDGQLISDYEMLKYILNPVSPFLPPDTSPPLASMLDPASWFDGRPIGLEPEVDESVWQADGGVADHLPACAECGTAVAGAM